MTQLNELSKERKKFSHFVIEVFGVNCKELERFETLDKAVKTIVKRLGLKVVNSTSHKFTPQGMTRAFILSSSHLIVHTWPEFDYLHIDLFCCSKLPEVKEIKLFLKETFNCKKVELRKIKYD